MADIVGELVVQITGDTSDFNRSVDQTRTRTNNLSRDIKKFGDSMTKFATLPILALGAASIKFASDAEEARAKFNTAFKGIEDRASLTAKTLSREYGLAIQSSEKLLGNTGDLLKGFGATADGALDFSLEIQQLAVDLASYNNVVGGADRVSRILTKSVLGNKDGLSELGVSLLDTDIKQELVRTGQEKLTGQAGKLAKAQATFTLILQQTGDAQGDYARTADSVANKTKLLTERAKDLAVSFGNELLPIASKILTAINKLFVSFTDLDDGTKRFLLTMAGYAAAIGPAIKAVVALKTAFVLLSGPIGIALLAVTGLVAGIVKLNEISKKLEEDHFGEIAKSTKKTAKEINLINFLYADWITQGKSVTDTLQLLQKEYGLTSSQLTEILSINEFISEEERLRFDNMNKLNKRGQALLLIAKKTKEEQQELLEIEKKITEANSAEKIQAYVDQNQAVQDILQANKSQIQLIDEQIAGITKLGLADSTFRDDQQKAVKQLQDEKEKIIKDELENLKGIEESELESLERRKNQAFKLAKAQGLETAEIIKFFDDKIQEEKDKGAEKEKVRGKDISESLVSNAISISNSVLTILNNQASEELRIIQKTLDTELKANDEILADTLKTNEESLESTLKTNESEVNSTLEKNKTILQSNLDAINAETESEKELSNFLKESKEEQRLFDQQKTEEKIAELLATGESEDIEEATRLQLKLDNSNTIRSLEEKAHIDRLAREEEATAAKEAAEIARLKTIEDAQKEKEKIEKAAAEESIRLEEATAAKNLSIEKDLAQKRYKIELEQYEATKAISLAQAVISTAQGIAASLASAPFPLNLILAAGTAAAGAVQVAAIESQPAPKRPKLATGAIVAGSKRGVDVTVAEGGNGEIIQGMGSKGKALRDQLANETADVLIRRMGKLKSSTTINITQNNMLNLQDEANLLLVSEALFESNKEVELRRGVS